jgi:hypothetical protein
VSIEHRPPAEAGVEVVVGDAEDGLSKLAKLTATTSAIGTATIVTNHFTGVLVISHLLPLTYVLSRRREH